MSPAILPANLGDKRFRRCPEKGIIGITAQFSEAVAGCFVNGDERRNGASGEVPAIPTSEARNVAAVVSPDGPSAQP